MRKVCFPQSPSPRVTLSLEGAAHQRQYGPCWVLVGCVRTHECGCESNSIDMCRAADECRNTEDVQWRHRPVTLVVEVTCRVTWDPFDVSLGPTHSAGHGRHGAVVDGYRQSIHGGSVGAARSS